MCIFLKCAGGQFPKNEPKFRKSGATLAHLWIGLKTDCFGPKWESTYLWLYIRYNYCYSMFTPPSTPTTTPTHPSTPQLGHGVLAHIVLNNLQQVFYSLVLIFTCKLKLIDICEHCLQIYFDDHSIVRVLTLLYRPIWDTKPLNMLNDRGPLRNSWIVNQDFIKIYPVFCTFWKNLPLWTNLWLYLPVNITETEFYNKVSHLIILGHICLNL